MQTTYTVPPDHTATITITAPVYIGSTNVAHPDMAQARAKRIEKLEANIAFYARVLKGFTSMGNSKTIELVNSYLDKFLDAEKDLATEKAYQWYEANL